MQMRRRTNRARVLENKTVDLCTSSHRVVVDAFQRLVQNVSFAANSNAYRDTYVYIIFNTYFYRE